MVWRRVQLCLRGIHDRRLEDEFQTDLNCAYVTENSRRFWQSLSPDLRERSFIGLLRRVFEHGKTEGVVGRDAETELLLAGVAGLLSQFARMLYFGEFQGPEGNWIAAMEQMIIKMCL